MVDSDQKEVNHVVLVLLKSDPEFPPKNKSEMKHEVFGFVL